MDNRFVIDASRRVVLEQALRRSGGTVADLAKTIGFPGPGEQREGLTLFRHLKRGWYRDKWSARVRAHADKKRIDVRARCDRPEAFRRGLENILRSAGARPGDVERLDSPDNDVLHIVFTFPTDRDTLEFTEAFSIAWLVGFAAYI